MYNFDAIVDRSQNSAAKFEEAVRHFGTNDVIPLWIADMDFKTAQPIIDAIKLRADQGIFGYTYRPGEYFAAIADWQKRRNGYSPDIAKMAFAPGVVPAMRMYLNMFVKPDAKILIQQPVYHPFEDIVLNTGRGLLVNGLVRSGDGYYTVDYDDFEQKAREADVFLLCNPHNPAGRVWTPAELTRMVEICLKHGVEILSDEIHSDLILRGKHTVTAGLSPEAAGITTTFSAASKTFNLAGLQASHIIFSSGEKARAYVEELGRMDIARNSCFSLVATIAAYSEGEEWLEQLLAYLRENMRYIREYCAKNIPALVPSDPEATYLNWIDARGLNMTDDALCEFLVKKAGVALSKGSGFGKGGEGFIRLNAACPKATLEKALGQIKAAVDER